MVNITALERDLDAKRQEGLALLAKTSKLADAEDRVFTDEEAAALKAIGDAGQDLKKKIARAKGDSELATALEQLQLQGVGNGTPGAKVKTRMSLGEQFVAAEGYDFFRKSLHRSQSAWRSPSVELFDAVTGRYDLRAATLTEDPASGGSLVVPDYQPGIQQPPMRRLVVADLLPSGTTDSNMVAFMREKVFTNAAAAVLEGGIKPESTLTFEAVQEALKKIAHWLPVTEEMLEDVAQIRSYIDARLRFGVQLTEEDELLNGTGVAPHLLGLTKQPGLAAPVARGAAESNADAIFRQIMTIFGTSLFMPDGIVMNPADWAQTVLTKTPQGDYLTAGPFAPIQSAQMWGLRVVVTPAQVAASAFVGAFQMGAQVFRKGGIRVEASNSHQDFFIKNLVAIRAEERLALAVYRPSAFGAVTGLGAPVYAPAGLQAPTPPAARGEKNGERNGEAGRAEAGR